MERYDLVVIGGGPGGYTAAGEAARLGLKTALIEEQELGGTCLHRGCIPTKAMLHAAELLRAARTGSAFGVHAENVCLDYGELLAYRQETVDQLAGGVAAMLRTAGVSVLHGKGQVIVPCRGQEDGTPGNTEMENIQAIFPGQVRVTNPEGPERILAAKSILLAAGSRPKLLPVPGIHLPGVLDSDGLFALQTLPESLLIIGGGVIGVEMAEAFSAMGTKVTLLEAQPRLLPEMDREIAQNLRMILKKRKVEIRVGAMLQEISRNKDGLQCTFLENGRETQMSAQYVLCAVGRGPAGDALFGEGLQPERTVSGHLRVDENFRTNIPGVYAIGDLIPGPQLAHAASAEGKATARLLAGKAAGIDFSLIPRCVYTSPEIAEVGIAEKEARERGLSVRTGKALMGANGRTQIAKGERGFIKVLANAETGEILGAQLMCERATDLIGEFTVAIANHLTAEQMLRAVRPHPTFEEAVGEALERIL